MANHSLNEFAVFVNQQLEQVETISEHLSKAIALIQVASCQYFTELPEKTIRDYLWALGDQIERAQEFNTDVLAKSFMVYKKRDVSAGKNREHEIVAEMNNQPESG